MVVKPKNRLPKGLKNSDLFRRSAVRKRTQRRDLFATRPDLSSEGKYFPTCPKANQELTLNGLADGMIEVLQPEYVPCSQIDESFSVCVKRAVEILHLT